MLTSRKLRGIFTTWNDEYVQALFLSHIFVMMFDDRCLATTFLQTNSTGQTFNLAWIFFTSSLKENSIQDSLPLRVAAGSWRSLFSLKLLSCCFCLKELALVCPVWVRSCFLQSDDWLKPFLQCLHVYGFSPVWVRSCCLKVDESLKDFRQCLHVCGFSPVWVLSCRLQLDDWLKGFLQCLQVYGFFPVWVRSCRLQSDDQLKDFLQYWQVKDFIPVWAFCSMQSVTWLKIQPQCWH